jgi:hypothetical protein
MAQHLFLALCRRYVLRPFLYHRERRNTVMIRSSRDFVDKILLPAFTGLESVASPSARGDAARDP